MDTSEQNIIVRKNAVLTENQERIARIVRDTKKVNISDEKARDTLVKVAEVLGCSQDAILSPSRCSRLVSARYIVCWYLHTYCKYSVSDIGRIIRRDHATVLYGISRVKEILERPALNMCLYRYICQFQSSISESA